MVRRSRHYPLGRGTCLACCLTLSLSFPLQAYSATGQAQLLAAPFNQASAMLPGLETNAAQGLSPLVSYAPSIAGRKDDGSIASNTALSHNRGTGLTSSSWLASLHELTPALQLNYLFACLFAIIALAYLMHRLYKQAVTYSTTRLEQKIDERTQALALENKRLHEMSQKDPLTGIKNRHFIEEVIDQDVNRVKRAYDAAREMGQAPVKADMLAFIVDIDHFKPINDTYGHLVGDHVLTQVAQRLNTLFRNYDYVVRWGGEEFLVVARFVDRQQIDKLAEKIRLAIETMDFGLEHQRAIRLTASVGAAPYPFSVTQADKISWEQVIHLADMALYAAKTSSRNTWFSYRAQETQAIPDEVLLHPDSIEKFTKISTRSYYRKTA